MRIFIILSILVTLGAGCAPRVPAPPVDDTPNSNRPNCERSGGKVGDDGFCECPDGYAPDPADFCLDAQGAPGGAMKP